MKTQPTSDQIAKLPKWAREHIENCERERDEANRILQSTIDQQTPTPFFTRESRGCEPSVGDRDLVRYFDVGTNLTVEFDGVHLDIVTPHGWQGRHGIELSWNIQGYRSGDVIFQPTSFQQARLFLPEKER